MPSQNNHTLDAANRRTHERRVPVKLDLATFFASPGGPLLVQTTDHAGAAGSGSVQLLLVRALSDEAPHHPTGGENDHNYCRLPGLDEASYDRPTGPRS